MAYNLLKGKRGIVFGALNEQSIAWKVAERCVEEGAQITLTNAPVALRFGKLNELVEKLNAAIIGLSETNIPWNHNYIQTIRKLTIDAKIKIWDSDKHLHNTHYINWDKEALKEFIKQRFKIRSKLNNGSFEEVWLEFMPEKIINPVYNVEEESFDYILRHTLEELVCC